MTLNVNKGIYGEKAGVSKAALAIILVVIIVAAGVGIFFTLGPGAGPEQPKVVKIGVLQALTGGAARYGQVVRDVINFIVEEEGYDTIKSMNAKIELVWADTQGKPEIARAEAERLITQEKVHVLFGTVLSSTTLTAAEVAERYGIPFVNEASSSPKLTRLDRKWFFRVGPHDELFIKDMFVFLKEAQQETGTTVKTMVIVFVNDLFGSTARDAIVKFNDDPEIGGYEVLDIIAYPPDITDASDIALRLKSLDPDIIFMASHVSDAILIQRAMIANNVKPRVQMVVDAGHTSPEFIETIGKDANYIISREVFSLDLNKPKSQEVAKKFRERYGYDLDGVGARAYDAFHTLLAALEKAASTDPEKIREALANIYIPPEQLINAWDGVQFIPHGEFDGGQNKLAKGIIVQFFDDRYYLVWPKELAVRPYVFPAPSS